MTPRSYGRRRSVLWYAALVHRISGIGLAAFLPFHFLTLGLAVENGARLDEFLRFADMPAVKIGETGLVFLLAVHFLGGLRILFVENFAWRGNQARLATAASGVAALVAFAFLVRVL